MFLGRSNSHAQKSLGKLTKPQISRKITSPRHHRMALPKGLQKQTSFPCCQWPVVGGIRTTSLTLSKSFLGPEKDPRKAQFAPTMENFLRITSPNFQDVILRPDIFFCRRPSKSSTTRTAFPVQVFRREHGGRGRIQIFIPISAGADSTRVRLGGKINSPNTKSYKSMKLEVNIRCLHRFIRPR